MGFSAAAVCVKVGEILKQVCGTEMLPGLKLSKRLQEENFSQLHRGTPGWTLPPLFLVGRKAHSDYF